METETYQERASSVTHGLRYIGSSKNICVKNEKSQSLQSAKCYGGPCVIMARCYRETISVRPKDAIMYNRAVSRAVGRQI